ncbi:Dihydroflavonol-4-reductase [Richelia intracellularis HH01]|uniref:Dihydroflavonol-4-reductase n=1 Tax=Richelia intracellularis HH01 TaxID=1165094 RepID=M1WT74_9NOST|nr:NAD-dependent epimerase/dehydratase family protein [Richelia intracellularis]CCH67874.1 Dihydroflavonol-4-reductase [Richelia intracellularis HH01]
MKSLVTGANGFTGSHLVRALHQQGNTVVGFVRPESDLVRIKDLPTLLFYGDIVDQQALRQAMANVDMVFHTAAYVELGLVDHQEMERVNVQGTQAVLEVAREMGISKTVYCSTIGIYGNTKGQIVDENFHRSQKDFSSAYDITKYKAQKIVDKFAIDGLPIVSVMPSGILGADDPHFSPALKLFLKGWLKLWVGGDRITGIVHVDDLVEAMILAAEKGKNGEHYIISAGELPTREIFAILSQETGIDTPIELPEYIVRCVGNILNPIGRIFNWNPPISKERVHYIYERCVRVSGEKARKNLGWNPRSTRETLLDIVALINSGI